MAKFAIVAACVLLLVSSAQAGFMDVVIETMQTMNEQIQNHMKEINANVNKAIAAAGDLSAEMSSAAAASIETYNNNVASVLNTDEFNMETCIALADAYRATVADAAVEAKECIDEYVTTMQSNSDTIMESMTEILSQLNENLESAESCDTDNVFTSIGCYMKLVVSSTTLTTQMASIQTAVTGFAQAFGSIDDVMATCTTRTMASALTSQAAESVVEVVQCATEIATAGVDNVLSV